MGCHIFDHILDCIFILRCVRKQLLQFLLKEESRCPPEIFGFEMRKEKTLSGSFESNRVRIVAQSARTLSKKSSSNSKIFIIFSLGSIALMASAFVSSILKSIIWNLEFGITFDLISYLGTLTLRVCCLQQGRANVLKSTCERPKFLFRWCCARNRVRWMSVPNVRKVLLLFQSMHAITPAQIDGCLFWWGQLRSFEQLEIHVFPGKLLRFCWGGWQLAFQASKSSGFSRLSVDSI